MARTRKPPEPAANGLVTLSIRVPPSVADRVRNFIAANSQRSLVEVGRSALEREIARLERANGGPFPERPRRELRRGRRSVL
jgi:hypothetical protein